jgi:Fic family protein
MDIPKLIQEYQALNLHDVIDHDRFNEYAIVHHSSSIEGSTLTEVETRLLLEEGTTPKGKPLDHSLMIKDHYEALRYTLTTAETKSPVSVKLIQGINARVMHSTGKTRRTILGDVDESKGEFRKGNVHAGGSYFIAYDKVEPYTNELVRSLVDQMNDTLSVEDRLRLSFSAHFDLVSIHPFYDGNGRTSRLLMNYVQQFYHLPLAVVFKEDKNEYFEALQQSRKQENTNIFQEFMSGQYQKHLQTEIDEFMKMSKGGGPRFGKGNGFSIFF